jgi:hypothetical protein
MDSYLIESPHELKDCAAILKQLRAMGYLNNFDWGCRDGVHTGWAIINAENKAQAEMAVPPLVRSLARIVKLNKFLPEEVDALHAE